MRRIVVLLLMTGVACSDDPPACPRGTLGCACDGGTCDNLVCADGECREAITCATCVEHQRCTAETPTSDAVCLSECDLGWTWNGTACEPDCDQAMVDHCALENRICLLDAGTAACADCLVGFLEEGTTCRAVVTCDDCALELRECTTPAGDHTDAECGDCTSGHTEDQVTGNCRDVYTCTTLPEPCNTAQTCIEATDTSDARCVTCPPCSGEGVTGSPYPVLTLNEQCICTTTAGYYYSVAGSIGAFPCDADNDGWVRVSARQYVENELDVALSTNARCTVAVVEEVELVNESGEILTITSAEDPDLPVPLYESVRNDVDGPIGGRPAYHDAAGAGRQLNGNEVNGLTKGCVEVNADYNDNEVPDVREWGRPGVGSQVSVDADFAVYTRYSYFLATHRGWFESGTFHIREKDRTPGAADGFALRYDPGESNFWQDCPRARDAWYSTEHPPIGMDFASVSGPAERTETWTGMMHHSQFKCVQVESTMPTVPADEPHKHTHASIASLGWDLNDCLAPDPGSSLPPVSGANPSDPELSCQVVPSVSGLPQVLWAAVRIGDIASYQRGCVVQCEGQPYLCPGSADPCWWMCGDFAGSETGTLTDGTWTVRGEVPAPALTEDVDNPMTDGTWTVKPRL